MVTGTIEEQKIAQLAHDSTEIRATQHMETEIRGLIATRLKEERFRMGLGQLDLANLGDTKLRTYQDWERGISPVQAEFLAQVYPHGLDVLYVITGVRAAPPSADALNSDDLALVRSFADIGAKYRSALMLVAEGIAKQK